MYYSKITQTSQHFRYTHWTVHSKESCDHESLEKHDNDVRIMISSSMKITHMKLYYMLGYFLLWLIEANQISIIR